MTDRKQRYYGRKPVRNLEIISIASQTWADGRPRWPLEYIAAIYGISKSAVCQLLGRAGMKSRQRQAIRSKHLWPRKDERT
jgi:hypothetical protein